MDDDFPPSAGPLDDRDDDRASASSSSSSFDGSADRSDQAPFPPAKRDEVGARPEMAPEVAPAVGPGADDRAPFLPLDDWPDSVWLTLGRRLGLSPVQLRIVRLMLVDELSNESIAHRLGRSRMSVDTQIARLYKKVGVKSRMGLVKRVYGIQVRYR